MKKNYSHNIIRLLHKSNTKNNSKVFWIVVILNKRKAKSTFYKEKLGHFHLGKDFMCDVKSITFNSERLAYYLNRGSFLKKSVKRIIYWLLNAYLFTKEPVDNNKNKKLKVVKIN